MKREILFLLVLSLFFSMLSLSTVQAQINSPLEDGKVAGRFMGEIYGQRDFINDKRSNWEEAFKEQEPKIVGEYNLDKETYAYRVKFLREYKEGFKEGYEKAYNALNTNNSRTAYDIGVDHGAFFGRMLGEVNGRKDQYSGKTNDWKRDIPSNTRIIAEYRLNYDTERYSSGFLIGFKNAYEESYTEAYRLTNVDNHRVTKEDGFSHGNYIGAKMGELLGRVEYADGKTNDWKRALPSDQEIILKHYLLRENLQYREGFIAGYKEGFKVAYTEAFRLQNVNRSENNINLVEMGMSGGVLGSKDKILTINVEPGAFYREVFFSVEKGLFPAYFYNNREHEPVTSLYEVKILNEVGSINLHKSIILTFQYHGNARGGIYQLIDGEWRYLHSMIEKDVIYTEISPGEYKGGIYAVFIDEKYKELSDVYMHWAGKEIYSFMRRYYVMGHDDGTFKPDDPVTRGQFLITLSRVLKWPTQEINSNVREIFSDYESFGVYHTAIQYGVARGYLKGYPDGTFKSHNLITYNEIGWIMQRVLQDNQFDWSSMEEKMLYEKFTRSKSRLDKNTPITRAEVVYMLYELQSQNKL